MFKQPVNKFKLEVKACYNKNFETMFKTNNTGFLMNPFLQFILFLIVALLIAFPINAQTIASTSQNAISNSLFTSKDWVEFDTTQARHKAIDAFANMRFTKKTHTNMQNIDTPQYIKVLELRNYLIRPGTR